MAIPPSSRRGDRQPRRSAPSAAHWGLFTAHAQEGEVVQVAPWAQDASPSPLLGNIPGSVRHASRVARPAVRRGWLERGPGPTDRRGRDEFVEPSWDEVLDRLAAEYARVLREHGNSAVYGGSYGWASAGRFHHAQSQLHRFLNCLGGYTFSVNTYSTAGSEVFLPHVLAPESTVTQYATTWDVVAQHTQVMLCFGGIPLKNTGTDSGGSAHHPIPQALARARAAGVRIVSVSPLRDDLDGAVPADEAWLRDADDRDDAGGPDGEGFGWLSIRPGTDVALMLALLGTLDAAGGLDEEAMARYCVGADELLAYVRGETDGQAKTPRWAAPICDVEPGVIEALARLLVGRRVIVHVGWSLQRVQHGEQALWAGIALAACLGQIGLAGGGFASGYGSMNKAGLSPSLVRLPSLPQGANPVSDFIPVARVSDMLLHPGEEFDYDGGRFVYPRIRLMHWAGGNPFHHHQHLERLRRALGRLDTLVVSEPYWTPMARHADIVLPSTTTLERNDLTGTRAAARLSAIRAAVPPFEQARDDYAILTGLASRLGVEAAFTRGRDEAAWLEHLYETWRADLVAGHTVPRAADEAARRALAQLPDFAGFWERGHVDLPQVGPLSLLSAFRADPQSAPLGTPSGRVELFSDEIKGFGYDDCPPHPTWLEPQEWLGGERARRFPLHLIANQPRTRLHSQLDHGATSQASKVAGREPLRLHPRDAAARGIADGDVVLVSNDRGACLAGAVLSDALRPGVAQLSTGAWYDPYDPARHGPAAGEHGLPEGACVHGNPNVLTADRGTSRLAQGCTGQRVLVQVARWDGPVPRVLAFEPPGGFR